MSLMMLLNVLTESILELSLQAYIVVEEYFEEDKMPGNSLLFSLVVGALAFASALVSTFMVRAVSRTQSL